MNHPVLILLAIFGYQFAGTQVLDCDSPIYCQGQLLDVVQRANIYNDSKKFVDLVQKNSPNVTLSNFQKLLDATNNNPTKQNVLSFINENFESESELLSWIPNDYVENPEFLNKINDSEVRSFAQSLVKIWPILGRKVNETVYKEQDRHSFIPLPNGFIIPGGRFAEIYYWDTYWIVKGLLISGMKDTVRGILENFLSLVDRFGFIPNGSRVYYLNRSQPPLLSPMVGLYMKATNNVTWLKEHICTLEQELNWWLENRTVVVEKNGRRYKLAQYNVKSGTPRPESYFADVKTCDGFENDEKVACYKNLKSAAESGWDFSSRWFFDSNGAVTANISLINTTRVIQVDVNSFLYLSFKELAHFYKIIGNEEKSIEWSGKREQWKQAIREVLYNEEDKIWYDWDIYLSKHRKEFYPSNFAPLWVEAYDPQHKDEYGSNAVDYLDKNKIKSFEGGIPTSLIQSGQQWDFPNAWPPLQEIIVLGLKYTENKKAIKASKLLAQRTIRAYMVGYNNTQEMFEKYDAVNIGQYGGGGEYVVQSGFGWSNGVALSLIELLYL